MTTRLTRGEGMGLGSAVAVYLATRMWHLTALPMFFDEAIHILWGDEWGNSRGLSRAMADGKLLQVVASAIASRLSPNNVFWASRLGTVLVGLVTLGATFWLGRRIGGPRGGVTAALLAVACPFLLFHDRMALADPFVSAFAALALVATISLCDRPSALRGVLLGLSLAAAGAAKTLGLFAFAFSLAGVALLAARDARVWRALALAWGVAGLLLWVPVWVSITRGGQIVEKAALFTESRLALVSDNVANLAGWLWIYWTPTTLALGLLATAVALARRRPLDILLVFAWAFPLVVFVLGARVWYPRYILLTTVPFLALVGGGLAEASSHARGAVGRVWALLLVAVVLVPGVLLQWDLLRDPASAPLPRVDRWQYIEGWPSGYGWAEAHEVLLEEMGGDFRQQRVATERYHWTLKALFLGKPGVVVKAFGVWTPSELLRAAEWVGREGGWLVVSKPVASDRPPGIELTHIAGFTKPGREGSVHVYRLRSSR